MKKRISIQYSIDEAQIGNECYRLLSNTLDRLTSIAAESPKAESIMNTSTVAEITNLRDELSQIDIMLEDVNAIIDGFLGYKYTQQSPQANSAQSPSGGIPIPDFLKSNPQNVDLDQLSSFVQQLKGAQPNDFDMDSVRNVTDSLQENIPSSDIDPDLIESVVENAKNLDPSSASSGDILSLLGSVSESGGPSIQDIEKKLLDLKARVDNNEIAD